MGGLTERKKWLFVLFFFLFVSFILFIFAIYGLSTSYAFTSRPAAELRRGPPHPPAFAYYIYGGAGDYERIFRLLLAVYHPRNRYVLDLSSEAGRKEREWLGASVMEIPAVKAYRNVDVIGEPIWLTYMGATNIAAMLRGAAILLKIDDGWDWFFTLSASDYPLLTPDDLAHAFSSIRRGINFIDHTSDLGWKEQHRIRPIVVDPSIYLARKSQIFTATQKRPIPEAFKIFTGSPWVTLSRSFLEFCIFGWDNLPRSALMYLNNIMLPQEEYFHTVACNAPEFRNSTVNNDLRYMIWDSPPKMEPHFLGVSDFDQMVQSGAAFARQFKKDDPVLSMIDEKVLHRRHSRVVPGGWCAGQDGWFSDACSQWGDVNSLKPGIQSKRFADSMVNLLDDLGSHCK